MLKRTHIAALALATATASSGALATGDAHINFAERLLEEARTFGQPQITGQAAGQIEARREQRREAENLAADEKRWREMIAPRQLN